MRSRKETNCELDMSVHDIRREGFKTHKTKLLIVQSWLRSFSSSSTSASSLEEDRQFYRISCPSCRLAVLRSGLLNSR